MEPFLNNISFNVNEHTYLKNPDSTVLGKKIIKGSIDFIEQNGVEEFNFKKLAQEINSTEASIYRYFENKYKLLLYLSSWYWAWLDSKLVLATVNIDNPEEQLNRAIQCVTESVTEDSKISHINEVKLQKIIYVEAPKAIFNQTAIEAHKQEYFATYKQVIERICDLILKINPDFKYPHMLISTVIEGARSEEHTSELQSLIR
jgi:AcrR family transcriptional regulator